MQKTDKVQKDTGQSNKNNGSPQNKTESQKANLENKFDYFSDIKKAADIFLPYNTNGLNNKDNSLKKENKKSNIKTTDLRKMAGIFLNNPETVTSEDFIIFQKAVGYQQAVKLLAEGRKRKKQEKAEKEAKETEQDKNPKVEKAESNQKFEKVNTENNTLKQPDAEAKPQAAAPAKTQKDTKAEKTVNSEKSRGHIPEKQNQNKIEVGKALKEQILKAKEEVKAVKNGKPGSPEKNEAVKEQNSDEKKQQNNQEIKQNKEEKQKKTIAQKEEKPDQTANAKKQESPALEGISKTVSGLGGAEKKAKKAPMVNIKMGEPENILEQIESVPPTQILHAHTQAAGISKASIDKQTQKTQASMPKIPAPTGLAPIKKSGTIKNKIAAINHVEPTKFKGEKSGGKNESIDNINIGSENEPDPDEIMEEAKKFSANSPSVNLEGDADPSQTDAFNQESSQSVDKAKQDELKQLHNDFGETKIFPGEDNTILKAKKDLHSSQLKFKKVSDSLVIPDDMEAQMNSTLAPDFKAKVGEERSKYSAGKEKFDTDVVTARSDSDNQVQQLKEDSKNRQIQEQEAAKSEVDGLKEQWRSEVDQAVSEYDKEAEAETKSRSSEISKVKDEKDKEVKEKLKKAEGDAHSEYKTAKKKADDKKKEKENEHENEKKSWFEKAADWVSEKAKQFVDLVKKAVNFIFNELRKAVKAIFELAKTAIVGLIELGRQLVVNIIKGLGEFLKGLVKIVFSKFPGISKKICGFIDDKVNKAVNKVNEIAETLKKKASDVIDAMANTVDSFLATVQNIYNKALDIIGNLAGNLKKIMEGIGRLGEAAKKSLPLIEGKLWEQLVGVDLTQPVGDEAVEGAPESEGAKDSAEEKLTDNDVEMEAVEIGEIDPELIQNMNLKDGETKYVEGSKNPETVDSIMNDFDAEKEAEKKGGNLGDAVKTRAQNAGKLLDQIKEFVIKWLKDNWLKLLLGVTGALAGIILLNILTGGAITAALPIIMEVVVNVMNISSIIESVTSAAKNIATYLTEGWAGNIPVAASAFATALAIGLLALASVVTSKLKKTGAFAKASAKGDAAKKALAGGAKRTAKAAAKGIKSLLKSGKKLVSKTGKFIINKGKLVIKKLGNVFPKGMKKLEDLTSKIIAKFRFKGFKFKLKSWHLWIYGVFNPENVLLAEADVKKVDDAAKNKAGVSGAAGSAEKSIANKVAKLKSKGFQEHHIISNKNALTKEHELFELAGYNEPSDFLQLQKNKMYLPNDASLHATRSIHKGKHLKSVSVNLADQMDAVVRQGKAEGWSASQFNDELMEIVKSERDLLRSGKRALNKNKR